MSKRKERRNVPFFMSPELHEKLTHYLYVFQLHESAGLGVRAWASNSRATINQSGELGHVCLISLELLSSPGISSYHLLSHLVFTTTLWFPPSCRKRYPDSERGGDLPAANYSTEELGSGLGADSRILVLNQVPLSVLGFYYVTRTSGTKTDLQMRTHLWS